MKIVVVGVGYVGLANAILLAQDNEVVAVDIEDKRVDMINDKISPIEDIEIKNYLSNKELNLYATTNSYEAYKNADFIIIAIPSNFDSKLNSFNTNEIDNVIEKILQVNKKALIVIKSTVPVGYTERVKEKFNSRNIIFSPEFLREGKALYDNLYPSRIVVGDKSDKAKEFSELMQKGAIKKDVPIIFTNSKEAESIKLFSNAYLAMRVAYFNELDTFAEEKGLDARSIIEGIGLDPRIGNYYNNPSFGYGGYCLPKDSRQLISNFEDIPNSIITSIVTSNKVRKDYIAEKIFKMNPRRVGIYRLEMKLSSDNFRYSAVNGIIKRLKERGVDVIIYEPLAVNDNIYGCSVIKDLDRFKMESDIIITNRLYFELEDVKGKVYTRDIFNVN
ncbi:nucleotide sugar dehydrogenase [Clostridium sp. DSM 100503]|uniref:nucleotide sugar dehydrogenase n=1 Tax=Clostridium sp. DSM 100503 TaxID=2963282 RepID=UPI00214A6FBD|nr:nucleotide sugar dehydrogenase [Clostridium sp. DSM 100503]MCR1951316.1 nucleotide sugar dehydrogenase [Clostridium sp. DSM 100503]